MRTFLVWAVLASPLAGQGQVVADERMVAYLERIADTATVETARCLGGEQRNDTIFVVGAFEAPWLIGAQTDSTVMFAWLACPPTTMALWHNHIAAWALRRYGWTPPCYLGGDDYTILRVRASPLLQIVSVRTGVSCVFVRLPNGQVGAVRVTR
jgi:hypothetical protein